MQKLQGQLADMCMSRDEKATDSPPSSPSIDYAMLSKFPRTITMPVEEKQSATDKRPACCFEGFAINRARHFLKGVLEGRMHQGPGEKQRLQSHHGNNADGPVHAKDKFADPLAWWFDKGIFQGIMDAEAGILPGENEKLELLFQVDPELLVLWLEKHLSLKKQYLKGCTSEAADKEPPMNELYQYGQSLMLADHLFEYHPDMSRTEFNITTAEARVRYEFNRIKAALKYLQKHQNQADKIESFDKDTAKFAELAYRFLKQVVEVYDSNEGGAEACEPIHTAFFTEFATLYPNPKELNGLDAEEIDYQKQFVVAVAKALGSLMSEQDNE